MKRDPNLKAFTPMSRSSTLTTELMDDIVKYINIGNHPKIAAMACGIPNATWIGWLSKGREEIELGLITMFTELAFRVDVAVAQSEVILVAELRTAGKDDWRSQAAMLERRYSSRWGKQSKIVVSADPIPAAVLAEMEAMEAAELAELYEQAISSTDPTQKTIDV